MQHWRSAGNIGGLKYRLKVVKITLVLRGGDVCESAFSRCRTKKIDQQISDIGCLFLKFYILSTLSRAVSGASNPPSMHAQSMRMRVRCQVARVYIHMHSPWSKSTTISQLVF